MTPLERVAAYLAAIDEQENDTFVVALYGDRERHVRFTKADLREVYTLAVGAP